MIRYDMIRFIRFLSRDMRNGGHETFHAQVCVEKCGIIVKETF